MRRLVFAGLFLALAGFVLYGQTAAQQPFVVRYVDGSVQVQLKGQTTWRTLRVRDSVPLDAAIKVSKGAMVELARDTTVLSLIKEGTFQMVALVSKAQATTVALGSTLAQKIRTVTSTKEQTSAAAIVRSTLGGGTTESAGAVRASSDPNAMWASGGYKLEQKKADEKEKAEAIQKNQIPREGFRIDNLQFFYWGINGGYANIEQPRMYEEYRDAIDKGIRALIDMRYEAAIEELRAAVNAAIFPDEQKRANYLLSAAYVEAGSPVRAWKIISGLSVSRDDLEFGDFLIRKAQLQVDALQYEDALATLKPLLEPLAEDEFGQAACLAAYYAWKGLGRSKEASDIKQKGLAIRVQRLDAEGNKIDAVTETARILATLE